MAKRKRTSVACPVAPTEEALFHAFATSTAGGQRGALFHATRGFRKMPVKELRAALASTGCPTEGRKKGELVGKMVAWTAGMLQEAAGTLEEFTAVVSPFTRFAVARWTEVWADAAKKGWSEEEELAALLALWDKVDRKKKGASDSPRRSFKRQRVAQLRDLCTQRGMASDGKKAALVARLVLDHVRVLVAHSFGDANWASEDDDQLMDARNSALENGRANRRDAVVRDANHGRSRAELLAGIARDVRTVVANIRRGDSPSKLEAAWLFLPHDVEAGAQFGAAQLLVLADLKTFRTTWEDEDARTLAYLFESGIADAACKALKIEYTGGCGKDRHRPVSGAAIDRMIDLAVEDGRQYGDEAWVPLAEAARLKAKYRVWLDGACWETTHLSCAYRPSLATFEGYAYESKHIMQHRGCGLRRGLPAGSVLEVEDSRFRTPELIAAEAGPHTTEGSFALVWSRHADEKAGGAADLGSAEDATKRLRVAYHTKFHALLVEQDGRKKHGSLEAFLAKQGL